MNHVIVIFHFISFTSGIGLITLSYFLYIRNKSQLIKQLVYADMFYTAILLIDTLHLYVRKNVSAYYEFFNASTFILSFISGIGMIFYLTSAVYCVTGRNLGKNIKKLFLIFSGFILLMLILNQTGLIPEIGYKGIADLYIYGLLAYNILFLLYNFKNIGDRKKVIVKSYMVSTFLMILIAAVTSIFNSLPHFIYKIPYTPLMYLLINSLGLIFIRKYTFNTGLMEPDELSSKEVEKENIFSLFTREYGITERELEIVKCIVDGNNNQEIGSKLFISPNTVKNHIYNIYRKLGIKNRYELISIMSKAQYESKGGADDRI